MTLYAATHKQAAQVPPSKIKSAGYASLAAVTLGCSTQVRVDASQHYAWSKLQSNVKIYGVTVAGEAGPAAVYIAEW